MRRGERNKGGVGNYYYSIPRARRMAIRNLARQYVATRLRNDDTPDWAEEHGVRHDLGELNEFDAEVFRIADRVAATIRK